MLCLVIKKERKEKKLNFGEELGLRGPRRGWRKNRNLVIFNFVSFYSVVFGSAHVFSKGHDLCSLAVEHERLINGGDQVFVRRCYELMIGIMEGHVGMKIKRLRLNSAYMQLDSLARHIQVHLGEIGSASVFSHLNKERIWSD